MYATLTSSNVLNGSTYYSASNLYFCSNESDERIDENLKKLQYYPEADIHFGVSGWQNYDIVILRNSQYMILVDINEAMCEFHHSTKDIILNANSIDDFVHKMLKLINEKYESLYATYSKKLIEHDFFWLKTPGGFEKIKNLYSTNNVTIAALDIADPNMLNWLSKNLHRVNKNLTNIDTFYISNVADWLSEVVNPKSWIAYNNPLKLKSFDMNLKKLSTRLNKSALIIYSEAYYNRSWLDLQKGSRKLALCYTNVITPLRLYVSIMKTIKDLVWQKEMLKDY